MPGSLYYAIPEEDLKQYKVGLKQFDAELSLQQRDLKSSKNPKKEPQTPHATVLGVRG